MERSFLKKKKKSLSGEGNWGKEQGEGWHSGVKQWTPKCQNTKGYQLQANH